MLNAPGETEGDPTGVMASEFTHPDYAFLDAGMEVDMASAKGGPIPIDPQTLTFVIRTPEDERFLEDPTLQPKVALLPMRSQTSTRSPVPATSKGHRP